MGIISYVNEEIQVIRERDPAIKSNMEVFLYSSFKAILHYRIAHKLYLKKHYFLARWVSQRAVRKTGIEIHPGATIGKGLFIDHGSGVIIGETAELGDNITLYQGVTLGGTGKEQGKRHPTLRDNVMVSAGAKVLGSFTIGENSKIGAGSVVLEEVPPNCTVVGVPGRVVIIIHLDIYIAAFKKLEYLFHLISFKICILEIIHNLLIIKDILFLSGYSKNPPALFHEFFLYNSCLFLF